MKKVIGKCSLGFYGAELEEEFIFEDDTPEEVMLEEIENWARGNLEIWIEEPEEEEEEEED